MYPRKLLIPSAVATFIGLLSLLLYHKPLPYHVLTASWGRGGVSAQTSFIDFDGCTPDQGATIMKAHRDALDLAEAGLSDSEGDWFRVANLDFDTRSSIDYFGPPSQNVFEQARIIDTLVRAKRQHRGIGWSDWWLDRYVSVACGNENEGSVCKKDMAAVTITNTKPYQTITYCPLYFNAFKPLDQVIMEIKKNPDQDVRRNVRNMRSQALISLHEWLHLRNTPAEVCQGGCFDIKQAIGGGELRRSYGPGLSKLLAKRKIEDVAARNNDNYVYYCASRHMQNIFGKYPEYPSAWDPNLNYEQNLARENREPGALSTYSENCSSEVWEPEPPKEAELQVPVVKGRRFSKSVYPKWYRSIINGEGGPDGPGPETSAHISPRYSRPGINDIVCKTKITSPLIEDCVHAFGRMNEKPDRDANKGKNGSWHWEGHSKSCALGVNYTGDWSNCMAHVGDIREHAMLIFEACQEGGDKGRVGGHTPFRLEGCPGTISIAPSLQKSNKRFWTGMLW